MPRIRIARRTRRFFPVLLALLLAAGGAVRGAEPEDDLSVDRALRRVLRTHLPVADRVAAAGEALRGVERADGETLARAGLALLEDAPEVGAWLLIEGNDRMWLDEAFREAGRARIDVLKKVVTTDIRRVAVLTAAGLLLHGRGEEVPAALTADWPPSDAVRAVLIREFALAADVWAAEDGARRVQGAVRDQLPSASALDAATGEDPERMRRGLDTLRQLGPAAIPLLVHTAGQAAAGVGEGRLPRATRAILALGLLRDRRATPSLVACLDAPNGWVQAAAATALGDLGDPAASIALCHKLTYRGDVLRPRDQWDFPGDLETTVPREDWSSVEYFVVDGAAADALLRLGVTGAVEWIVRNQLDPTKANFRIRVLQDGVDALRRAVPDAPIRDYNVDRGIGPRMACFERLLSWWNAHRFNKDLLGVRFEADDPAWKGEARRMVERLRGRSVMELQISQETCALLGPLATPVLLETLQVAKSLFLRTEIARALGAVRDPDALPALLALLRDRASFIRAVSATSLGAYVPLGDEAVRGALLGLLDDPEAAPRVAAIMQVVALPVSDTTRAVLGSHPPKAWRERFGTDDRDYRMGWTVAMLVQEGAAWWPQIRRGLTDPERYVRRTWWDLLRRALALPNHVYDANTDPSEAGWEPVDEERIGKALEERRSR